MSGAAPTSTTVAALLRAAAARLGSSGSPQLDAELLLAETLGVGRGALLAQANDTVEAAQAARFAALVGRRAAGEPLAYLTGRRDFWTLTLAVTPDVLVPRPETELLVERALALVDTGPADVADLGTGTGAIALALAHERPLADITAIDLHARALSVAHANAARLQLGRVRFLQGNWFSAVRGERYDVIVGNPPYIAEQDPHLQQGDLRFEPRTALASGIDGLEAIRVIARDSPRHLGRNGWLLLEHGFEQGAEVRALLTSAGFTEVTTETDLAGLERVTSGQLEG